MNTAQPIRATHFSPFFPPRFSFLLMHTKLVAIRSPNSEWSAGKAGKAVHSSVYGLQRVNRAVIIRRSFVQLAAIVAIAVVYTWPTVCATWSKRLILLAFHLTEVRWKSSSKDDVHGNRDLRLLIVCSWLYQIIMGHYLERVHQSFKLGASDFTL